MSDVLTHLTYELTVTDHFIMICQMTGLDPDNDLILEIYCLITDGQLNLLNDEGWGTIVHQSKARMDAMDDWCTRVHGGSGLTDAVLRSTVTPEQAADGLLAYIQQYVPERNTALLAGNSVHADRAFLRKAPYDKVLEHLHYRILDVSSIKEAARRWCPKIASKAPRKKGLHKAKDDILESIEEAKYFKAAIFHGTWSS
ncbi:Phosphatidylinositol 3,4,5-trisphosphate-dependent Rac exchanger 2 protein [Podospora pseudopauciseta]|uniref:Phosphatidylinositol 3,4,5-trisphosphate-dependent Rac exchanger 2 protein n=1 Tax=Podospora pseudopauciseta TaxID=2093780 RepID=A0ABR0I052_9PEZI|nr:Phosphatidylinositol 3,4,5-trisphosphate-dependent Rac exchanger 2 protein [Podospora pseudopauciseta]